MAIQIEHSDNLEWVFHDAELYSFTIEWEQNGEQSIYMSVEINPYEDNQPLIDRGIINSRVKIHFNDVTDLKVDAPGNYSNLESFSTWDSEPIQNTLYTKHTLTFSGGLDVTFRCSQVFLDNDSLSASTHKG